MRKCQVSIQMERFGDLAPDGHRHAMTIYADGNCTYEALLAAFAETLDVVQKHFKLPSVGRRDSSEMLVGHGPGRVAHSEDKELQEMIKEKSNDDD